MEKKLTKAQMFNRIRAHLTDPAEIAFVDHELELLAKKNSSDAKPTAKQTENDGYKKAILDAMEDGVAYRVMDMAKNFIALADLSPNRISALVTQLKNDGKIVRTEEKRVAYFTKAK